MSVKTSTFNQKYCKWTKYNLKVLVVKSTRQKKKNCTYRWWMCPSLKTWKLYLCYCTRLPSETARKTGQTFNWGHICSPAQTSAGFSCFVYTKFTFSRSEKTTGVNSNCTMWYSSGSCSPSFCGRQRNVPVGPTRPCVEPFHWLQSQRPLFETPSVHLRARKKLPTRSKEVSSQSVCKWCCHKTCKQWVTELRWPWSFKHTEPTSTKAWWEFLGHRKSIKW